MKYYKNKCNIDLLLFENSFTLINKISKHAQNIRMNE